MTNRCLVCKDGGIVTDFVSKYTSLIVYHKLLGGQRKAKAVEARQGRQAAAEVTEVSVVKEGHHCSACCFCVYCHWSTCFKY